MENIIIKPILTEKMADLGEKLNRYGFEVKTDANKIQIKNAIESTYGVSVKSVNTMKHGGGKRKMKYTNKGVSFHGDCSCMADITPHELPSNIYSLLV